MEGAALVELKFQVFPSALSLIGSLLMIVTYLVFPQLHQFSYHIVFYLAISDFLGSTANLLSISRFFEPIAPAGLCIIQAIMKNYTNICSILWVDMICWTMYSTVVLGKQNDRSILKRYIAIGFGIPVLFLIP